MVQTQSALSVTSYAVTLLTITTLLPCSSYYMKNPLDDVLRIDSPGQLQLFTDGHIGQEARIVRISSSAAVADLFHHAADFSNRTNAEIELNDGNNSISLQPADQSVRARFLNGTNMTKYLPKWYKSYSLTFGPEEANNVANWRDIFTFHDAENSTVGDGFEVGAGYRSRIHGLWNLSKLNVLTVHIDHKTWSDIDLSLFMYDTAASVRQISNSTKWTSQIIGIARLEDIRTCRRCCTH